MRFAMSILIGRVRVANMARWWKVLMLVAASSVCAMQAGAQQPPIGTPTNSLPKPIMDLYTGPPPMPLTPVGEPQPVAASSNPNNPYPGVPMLADRKPPPKGDFSPYILANEDNAWAGENCPPFEGWFFSLGGMGLWRAQPGNTLIAVRDPNSNGIDTNFRPPQGLPALMDIHDIIPRPNWGARTTFGYRWDCEALEFTGFYLWQNNSAQTIALPGRIDLPFGAFNTLPLGFQGNNNLWLQADLVREQLRTTPINGEINYRTRALSGAEYIIGVRYFDYDETYRILTDDDVLVLGRPDPLTRAEYTIDAHSHFIGLNLGFEVEQEILKGFALGFAGKGAFGANFVDVITTLQRGDGFTVNNRRSDAVFSYLFDGSVFSDLILLDSVRFRLGYNILWLLNFPQATRQLDFNLSAHPTGYNRVEGDIFYQGFYAEIQFQF
jgi:hypothetical protein